MVTYGMNKSVLLVILPKGQSIVTSPPAMCVIDAPIIPSRWQA
jgi:hypothetical protein